jgi:hypothetical protein
VRQIARFPKAIREELNRRLDDGASGKSLVRWLNELPEVQDLVKNECGGRCIREPISRIGSMAGIATGSCGRRRWILPPGFMSRAAKKPLASRRK